MKKLIITISFLCALCPLVLQAEAQYGEYIDEKVIVIDNEGQVYKGILEKEMTTKIVLVGYGQDAQRQFVDIENIQEVKIDQVQQVQATANNVLYVVGVGILLVAYLYLKFVGLPF